MTAPHFAAERLAAIRYWNELLADCRDPDGLVESLVAAQLEQGLCFDGRPFCTVARPRFVAAAEMVAEGHAVTLLSSAIRKVQAAALADERLRATHLPRFEEWASTILSFEPRAHEAWSILRFDSFLTGAGLQFVEVNGDIPMGSVGNDGAVRLFQDVGFFPAFRDRYEVRANLVNIGMVQTFLHAWQVWGGTGTPRVCVLSFPGGMQDVFARLNERLMSDMGFEVTAAYPGDLEFQRGRLQAKGRVVDLVYRLQHVYDCLERQDEMQPLLTALKAEAICMVNPFRSAVTSHKGLFALLGDPDCDFGLSDEERQAVATHVPWGRTLRDARTTGPDGTQVDLLEYAAAHRKDLVVKPAHEAGGAGVRLGWECDDDAAWEAALREALEGDCIVQRRVDPTRDEYPRLEKGLPLETFYEDTDPFVFPGGYVAVLDRVSTAEITNVALGGSMVPTFVIDPR
jgi:hypothetical protein